MLHLTHWLLHNYLWASLKFMSINVHCFMCIPCVPTPFWNWNTGSISSFKRKEILAQGDDFFQISFFSKLGIMVCTKVKLSHTALHVIIWRGSRDRCKPMKDCQKCNTMSLCVCVSVCITSGCPCSTTRPCVRCTRTLSAMPVHFSAYVQWTHSVL